jgi:hypothetical protein
MTKAQIINARLTSYLHDDCEVDISVTEPQLWRDNFPALGPWAILGFGMPILVPNEAGGKETIVPFCPEIIAETCEDYSDEEFDDWIDLVKAIIGLYICHVDMEDRDSWHDLMAIELADYSEGALAEVQIQLECADYRYQMS